jgi:hypothetical protein
MVDPVQMILLLVILVLTILLVILGIQVYYILREVRETIIRTNRVLDNAESITENIDAPLSALSSLALGAKASSLLTVAKFVRSMVGRNSRDEDKDK